MAGPPRSARRGGRNSWCGCGAQRRRRGVVSRPPATPWAATYTRVGRDSRRKVDLALSLCLVRLTDEWGGRKWTGGADPRITAAAAVRCKCLLPRVPRSECTDTAQQMEGQRPRLFPRLLGSWYLLYEVELVSLLLNKSIARLRSIFNAEP